MSAQYCLGVTHSLKDIGWLSVDLAGAPDVQLALELVDPAAEQPSGLPDMSVGDRVQAELSVLGLDVTSHLIGFYVPMLRELGAVRSTNLLGCRSQQEVLVAGVKVATQTPPIKSGRRVIFLTLDDTTGLSDATFFEDVQGPYASTVFGAWLLVVKGIMKRTGPRGRSLRATAAWISPASASTPTRRGSSRIPPWTSWWS